MVRSTVNLPSFDKTKMPTCGLNFGVGKNLPDKVLPLIEASGASPLGPLSVRPKKTISPLSLTSLKAKAEPKPVGKPCLKFSLEPSYFTY